MLTLTKRKVHIPMSLKRQAMQLVKEHRMPKSLGVLTALALIGKPNAKVEVVRPTPQSKDPVVLVDGVAVGGWF